MLKKYWKLIVSSIVIILPTVVALLLKEYVKTAQRYAWHFTWIMPVILVLFHVLLHFVSESENKSNPQNEKINNLTYWVIPGISVYVSALFLALSLGFEFSVGALVSGILGVSFIVIGNYLPKCKQSHTVGIRLPWTLNSEENWNKTHRLGGYTMVVGGIVIFATAFIGIFWLFMVITAVMIIIPITYSFVLYKKGI